MKFLALAVVAASLLSAALGTTAAAAQSAAAAPTTAPSSGAVTVRSVAAHYAVLVHANYQDARDGALALQKAIAAFTAAPSAAGLAAARKAWLDAREAYGQTEAFRFYGGPIDDDNGPEGRINAWPMDESYVDYVKDAPSAGIVNDRKVAITKKGLAGLNERDGEENVATGWHAIEFLLWGQDLSDTGPGERSFEDYVVGQGQNAQRRARYLTAATELLVDDLTGLVKAWAPGSANNYRARFEKGGAESVRKMIVGLGSLSRGELAGERIEVALNSQDQEDEHSCFSDNTHRDIVTNAMGIQNVWLGQYQRRDGSELKGPGLRDLVAAKDAALADKTTAQIGASVTDAQAIPAPFDQAIAKGAPGRPAIEKTVASLVEQSKLLVASASAVGITRLTLVGP